MLRCRGIASSRTVNRLLDPCLAGIRPDVVVKYMARRAVTVFDIVRIMAGQPASEAGDGFPVRREPVCLDWCLHRSRMVMGNSDGSWCAAIKSHSYSDGS